jgi:hypothetical protein
MSKKELIFIYHHVLGNKFIFKNKSDFKSDIWKQMTVAKKCSGS